MSVRNIRKLYGENALPPPEGNSEEEYEPLYAKSSSSKFNYQGLVLSSHSESEHESTDAIVMETTNLEDVKKKKKRKKKQRKIKQMPRSSSKDNSEMDEIEKSVMEVNAMLGTPSTANVASENAIADSAFELLAVHQRHLNVSNELKKMFGPEALDQGNRRRGRQPNLHRLLKKAVIVPMPDTTINFQKFGLSMSIARRDHGLTYFTFDHSKDYQRLHSAFLQISNYRANSVVMPVEEAQRNMHVEGLLEGADSMFRLEEYTAANTLIEQVIAYMQHVAHPSFNLTDGKTRLAYKYIENRPFHIAVLKYLYLLTNRACHRTALELAKLLLNLDPSDPLAVLFIIDTLALRAREHQWLIDAVNYWSKERDAGFMFNIQYSYAMAHFHLALKNKADLSNADKSLQLAMLRFPTVVMKIFSCANMTPNARLQTHPLFNALSDETTTKNLKDLIFLYAKFTWSKWREQPVIEWLTRNAIELADKYDRDVQIQERAKKLANERLNLFQGWPEEVTRHMSVIKPMANLLVDGAVPHVNRARAYDPVPPANGINRYGYELVAASPVGIGNSALYELFSSILPHYEAAVPPERQAMERRAEDLALADLHEGQNNAEIEPGAVAEAEDDTLTDEDGTENELEAQVEGRGDSGNLVISIGVLTNAVRRFMDIYETGRDPDEDEPNDIQEEERPNQNEN